MLSGDTEYDVKSTGNEYNFRCKPYKFLSDAGTSETWIISGGGDKGTNNFESKSVANIMTQAISNQNWAKNNLST